MDVFYVISGFLVTGLMLRDVERGTLRHQLVDFYARRARRILPAASVVILATLAAAAFFEGAFDQARAADAARSAALFYSNVRQAAVGGYFGDNDHELFQQYWSLSVEEQFYALAPLVVLGICAVVAAPRRRIAIAAVAGVASLASFALSVSWVQDGGWLTTQPQRAYFLLPSRLWELGVGVLIAVAAPWFVRLGAPARRWLLTVGLIAIAVAMGGFSSATAFPGWTALLPVLGTAAVLVAGTGGAAVSRLTGALSHRSSQLVGQYSYSLYLWHWPIVLFLAPKLKAGAGWPALLVGTAVLSSLAAVATFHLVEEPFRRAPRLRARPSLSLAVGAASVALCVVAAGTINMRARDELRRGATRVRSASAVSAAAVVPTDFVPRGVTPELPYADKSVRGYRCGSRCEITRPGTATVALFGDSHALHFAPGFERAAEMLNVSLTADSKNACPWFLVVSVDDSIEECQTFRDETFARYRAKPPDVIVLSSRNDSALFNDAAGWEAGIRRGIALLPRESRVVVLGETPVGSKQVPRCLSRNLEDTRQCEPEWPDAINAQLRAVVESAGASFVDLRPAFCTADRCPAIIGNTLVYADDDHITAPFSVSLGPRFAGLLTPMLAGAAPVPTSTTTTTQLVPSTPVPTVSPPSIPKTTDL